MKPMLKLFALTPVLALAAACGGISPTAPDFTASDEGSAFVQSSSTKDTSPVPSDCDRITSVEVRMVPGLDPAADKVMVEALYRSSSGSVASCAAPLWTSNPRGAVHPVIRPGVHPFVASVTLAGQFRVTVTAKAPNGIKGTIDLPQPPASTQASICGQITDVRIAIVPQPGQAGYILLETGYYNSGRPVTGCTAPHWQSTPNGALVTVKDPFRIGVSLAGNKSVLVSATAPNGKAGRIQVGR